MLALGVTAASSAEAQTLTVRHDGPRLRFGASGIGGGFVGAVHGAVGGLALRIGVQVTDVLAIYLQGQGLVGSFLPEPRGARLTGLANHALMLDLTLADVVQIGAGPSLDFIWGCSLENDGAACARQGPYFGGDFRLALAFGGPSPGRRAGLVLSADVHPTWVDSDFVTTLLFGIGIELY